jgi:predicted type IV restriction endonuclease
MAQTIPAEKVTLYDLEKQFGLQFLEDPQFFEEWQVSLPSLTDEEKRRLERVKASYENLARRSVLENTVKMAIVSPLLDLAGFFLPPFYVNTEEEVQIIAQEEGVTVRGRIDVLVLKEQFWVLVIESKRAEFSLKVGIPQALAYMLASPNATRPLFGMVTNGSNFIFLKLMQQTPPRYARSKEFVLERDNDLELVLQVVKRLANCLGDSI